MKIHEVAIKKIEHGEDLELTNRFYRTCIFCDKTAFVDETNRKSCSNLSGGKFYCPFCLRHNFQRRSKDILILSFRAIIGYYYYMFYDVEPEVMWLSQIQQLIVKHEVVGLASPAFYYDDETYLWFIDFSRIGTGKKKAPFEEVLKTTRFMFDVFNLGTNLATNQENETWTKFEKAMKTFYLKRTRPKNKRMLVPTIKNNEDLKNLKNIRSFTSLDLLLK